MMTYSGIYDDNRKLKALRLRPGRKTSMTTSDPHPVNQLWESKPGFYTWTVAEYFVGSSRETRYIESYIESCVCDVGIKIQRTISNVTKFEAAC